MNDEATNQLDDYLCARCGHDHQGKGYAGAAYEGGQPMHDDYCDCPEDASHEH